MVHQSSFSAFSPRRRRRGLTTSAAEGGYHDHDSDDDNNHDDDAPLLPLITRNLTPTTSSGVVHSPSRRRASSKKRSNLLLYKNILGLFVIFLVVLCLEMVLQGDFLYENSVDVHARFLHPNELLSPKQQSDANALTMTTTSGVGSAVDLKGTPLSVVPREIFEYYSPSPTADVKFALGDENLLWPDNDDNYGESTTPPILHFVHTRFMQEQANLTALGEARLHLFDIFCLPSMVEQTTDNFFWIIRLDPDLDASVFAKLLRLVQENTGNSNNPQRRRPAADNVYLVASNHNFRINEDFPGAWRDGAQSQDLMQSRIYSGNPERLAAALNRVDDYLILETRLDADDGLHIDYLRTLQQLAWEEWGESLTEEVESHNRARWKYWCAGSHVEWHWVKPEELPSGDDELTYEMETQAKFGYFTGSTDSLMCITPGITVAFPVGVREEDVPVFPHHELAARIARLPSAESCGTDSCLEFVREHSVEAIRSRTPTSAGMLKIVQSKAHDSERHTQSWQLKYAMWTGVKDMFKISRVRVEWVHSYLTQHLYDIGLDNLHGQCTSGHSCKPEAKRDLEELLKLAKMAELSSANG